MYHISGTDQYLLFGISIWILYTEGVNAIHFRYYFCKYLADSWMFFYSLLLKTISTALLQLTQQIKSTISKDISNYFTISFIFIFLKFFKTFSTLFFTCKLYEFSFTLLTSHKKWAKAFWMIYQCFYNLVIWQNCFS